MYVCPAEKLHLEDSLRKYVSQYVSKSVDQQISDCLTESQCISQPTHIGAKGGEIDKKLSMLLPRQRRQIDNYQLSIELDSHDHV